MSTQSKRKHPDSITESSTNKKNKINNKNKNKNNNNNNTNLLKSNTNGVTSPTIKKISLAFGIYITTQNKKAENLKYINIIGNPSIAKYLSYLKFYKKKNFLYTRNKVIPQCNLKMNRNALFYGPRGNGKETIIKKFCVENDIPLILVKNENISSEKTMNAEIMKQFFKTIEILSESKIMIIILFSKCDYLFGFKASKTCYDKVDESVSILIDKMENYHNLNKNIFTIATTSKFKHEINVSIMRFYERIGLSRYAGQLENTEYQEIWKNILIDIGISNIGFLESATMQEVINLCSKHYTHGQISDFISKVINDKLISLNENSEISENFNFTNLILRDEDFSLKIHKAHSTRRLTIYDAAQLNFQKFQ